MSRIIEYTLIFLIGATVYSLLEVLFRGFTHWTMFMAGGLSFAILYGIFTTLYPLALLRFCLAGALVITTIELLFGFIFNLVLGLNVWDYAHYPLNFMGQICLPYTLLWFLLSAPVFWITKAIRNKVFKNLLPPLRP
jgi:uncharacterized membrane protein